MNHQSSRRLFLRGAAVAMGLPFLESMPGLARAATAASCAPAKRFLSFYLPCGVVMPDWTPTTTGVGWTMPYILAPLEPVRNKILVLTGLDHMKTVNSAPGGHSAGTAGYMTMRPLSNNYNDANRTSLDQVIAEQSAACNRPLPSMQLSVAVPEDSCDSAPCPYVHTVSYNKNTPLPHETSPKAAFDRLFAGYDPKASTADAQHRAAMRKSVLDHVNAELTALAGRVNANDKAKLDEYATAVRDLETRVVDQSGAVSCGGATKPAAVDPAAFADRVAAMIDITALAFQCDMTRVVSLMMGRGSSLQDWSFLVGQSTPHHRVSHHNGDKNNINNLRQIDRWEITQLATLLKRLDGMAEAGGKTVLDNTIMYCSSEISDGNSHNKYDMPVLLAGGGGGRLKADGRHISYTTMPFPRPLVGPSGGPHTEHTMVSILNAFDINVDTFGDGMVKGPNTDILVS